MNNANGDDEYPQITGLGSDGSFAVTWSGQDSAGRNNVFVQKFDGQGQASDSTVQLSATNNWYGYSRSPQITALGSDGSFAVTWYGLTNGFGGIFVQKFDGQGQASGSTVQLNVYDISNVYNFDPQITALGSDGSFAVTWVGQDDTNNEYIFVQKFGADGLPEQKIYGTGDTVTVVFDPQGNNHLASVSADFSALGASAPVTAILQTDGSYQGLWLASYTVAAGHAAIDDARVSITATDTGGNHTTTQDGTRLTLHAETAPVSINLGDYGTLIAPVNVDGKWYYAWDMNGDGVMNNTTNSTGKFDATGGVVNSAGVGYQSDLTSHDVLDGIFKYASDFSTVNPGADTNNSFRFANIGGVKLTLPTVGDGTSQVSSAASKTGTAIDNSPAGETNLTYDDLLAVWDGYNGSGVDSGSSGTPAGWVAEKYWAATPGTSGHAYLDLANGSLAVGSDLLARYVAVQVLL